MGGHHLKVLCEDQTGIVYLDMSYDRVWLHCKPKTELTLSVLKHYLNVFAQVRHELKNKGITEVYSFYDSDQIRRWNYFMGFKETNEILNETWPIMKMEIKS